MIFFLPPIPQYGVHHPEIRDAANSGVAISIGIFKAETKPE